MSQMITRCPSCGTMFKVVPDQLRISEGWVRCGHCSEIFDASAHMSGDAPSVQPPAPATQPPYTPTPAVQPPAFAKPNPEPERASAPAHFHESAEPPPQAPLEPAPMAPPPSPWFVQPPAAADAASDLDPISAVQWHPEPPLPEPSPAFRGLVEPAFDAAADAGYPDPTPDKSAEESAAGASVFGDPADADAPLEDLSFVRDAQRKQFWRRPAVRAVLALVALLLVCALLLQVAVQERDRIAAMQPDAAPLLQALCEPLQCTVSAPRQIESIVIDSSSFSKMRGDAYRLSFTIKNQAPILLAMPAIELTLTDTQDQPVLRRVLTPAELGVPTGVIAAASEWPGSLALSVVGGTGASRVAGYRVLAFYP